MVQSLRKTVWQHLTKINREIPCDPAILLPGIQPKKMKAGDETKTNTNVQGVALLTTAKKQKQPKHPSADGRL